MLLYQKFQEGSKIPSTPGSDTYTRFMNMAGTFGTSAVGDFIYGVSPKAAKAVDKYTSGIIPYTTEEQLAANRGPNAAKFKTAQNTANNVTMGILGGKLVQKLLPYVPATISSVKRMFTSKAAPRPVPKTIAPVANIPTRQTTVPAKKIPNYAPTRPEIMALPPRRGYGNATGDDIVNAQANTLRNKGVGADAFDVSEAIGRYAHTKPIPNEVYRGVKMPLNEEGLSRLINKRVMNYKQVPSRNILHNNEGVLKMQSYAVDPNLKRVQGIDGSNIGNSNYMHNNVWTSNKQGASEYGRYASEARASGPQGLLQKFSVNKDKPLFGAETSSIGNLQELMSKKLGKPVNQITLKESEDVLRKWGIDYFSDRGFRGVPEYHFLPGKTTATTSEFLYRKGGVLYKKPKKCK